MKKALYLLLFIFLFGCEKVDEPKIEVETNIICLYPDFDELNIVKLQHRIDTEGIIYLHNFTPGLYSVDKLNFSYYIECNWNRILKKPYATSLELYYVISDDTIKRVLNANVYQFKYGDNKINYTF